MTSAKGASFLGGLGACTPRRFFKSRVSKIAFPTFRDCSLQQFLTDVFFIFNEIIGIIGHLQTLWENIGKL